MKKVTKGQFLFQLIAISLAAVIIFLIF